MKVLDLFAGCGGFSHGFQQAGFKITHAIDNWKGCKKTYEHNHPDTEFVLADIRELSPRDFLHVDVVIGSPPCVEFSTAKTNPDPSKGMVLVREFFKWVKIIKPKYWVMENVPGVKKYISAPVKRVLNAANYGVPQFRKRCFAGKYPLPSPTHVRGGGVTLFGKRLKKLVPMRKVIMEEETEGTNSSVDTLLRKLNSSFGMQKRYANLSLDSPCCTITGMHGDSPIIFVNLGG